jgi:uncharacterized protein (TIGR00266 family)
MQDRIEGTVLPVLVVELQPGEMVMSEVGEFSWMSDSIQISTGSATPGKGLMAAAKRMAGGASFLFNRFTAEGSPGMVAFATKLPGAIFPIDLQPGVEYFAHRHGFMAGTTEVEVGVALQQTFKGGIFGGEGFILQHLKGNGRAWIEMSGEISTYDLQPGQSMRVHPGHVALFQASVTFQVVRVPGLANRYLGDDGHHFVVLTGPGRIWLQSMPIPILAGALEPYLGDSHPVAAGAAGGAAASMIGGILRGR